MTAALERLTAGSASGTVSCSCAAGGNGLVTLASHEPRIFRACRLGMIVFRNIRVLVRSASPAGEPPDANV
jgi:hypothetical protein